MKGTVLLGALLMPDAGSNYVTLSAPEQTPPQGSIRVVFAPSVSFLWHNVIGAVTVLAVGTLLSLGATPERARS